MLDWRKLQTGDKLIYTFEEFGYTYAYPATVVGRFEIGTENDHVIASSPHCGGCLWVDDWSAHMFRRDK